MLDFSTITSRRSGSVMIGSGAATIPGIDEPLEVVADAEGEPPLGDVLPDDVLVQVGDQGLGGRDRGEEGFLRRSLRRRGGFGDGWGWGLISESALLAQKAQIRVVESKPPSKSGMSWLKQKSQQTGWSSDMGTPGSEAFQDHPRWVVGCLTRGCQFVRRWASVPGAC